MMRASRVLVVALLVVGCTRRTPAPDAGARAIPPPRADGRLPREVRPTRYALELTVDPSQPHFSGRARVSVVVDQPVSAIIMNARGLTVGGAALVGPGGRVPATTTLRLASGSKDDPEELVLSFDRAIPAGSAELEIDYEGAFASGLRGLYRVEEGGRWYAFTQFEPTDARRAFPVLRRARLQDAVRRSRVTVPAGIDRAGEHARGCAATRSGGRVTFEFEASPAAADLSRRVRGRGVRRARGARRHARRCALVAVTGKAGLGAAARSRRRGAQLGELERYFGRALPLREAGPGRGAELRRGRDGERRR